jgi:hypothetical protein
MRQEVKQIIDEEEYTFYQMNPEDSLKLLTKLAKMLGISIGKALSGSPGDSLESALDTNLDVGKLIGGIAERLDEDEVMIIVKMSLSQVMHSGKGELSKPTVFNEVFKGKIAHMLKVVTAALKVEYSDFFGGSLDLKELIGKVKG